MATSAEAAPAKPKGKKKLIIIILAVVILLVALMGVAAVLLLKKQGGDEEGGGTPAAQAAPTTPPVFLPIDNMVVNLADPGGSRFAQVGITFRVDDNKTSDEIKALMPTVRNGILLLLSQRTTEELLQVQGKEKLAQDIINESSRLLGYGQNNRRNPIQAVLFSSFIVQ